MAASKEILDATKPSCDTQLVRCIQANVSKEDEMSTRLVSMFRCAARLEARLDGSQWVHSTDALVGRSSRLTERLEYWAEKAPQRVLFARRSETGWERVTYRQAMHAMHALGEALLDRGLSADRPVLILSGNSVEHGLLSLACLYTGVPFVPVSPAYSLVSTDYSRLRDIVTAVAPGLVFADNATLYGPAIAACIPAGTQVVLSQNRFDRTTILIDELLKTIPTRAVVRAAATVGPDTVAKILFTSGSTGHPKGVIVTHGMLSGTAQMLSIAYPDLVVEPPVIVDWLPWHHILGGNCNFGLVVDNGGTLYIDDGKPLAGQIEETVRNLREIAPTFYFNVPKGYEALVPWLRRDRQLRESFFSRVRFFQYAGASVAPHVCAAIDDIALDTVGERIQWVTMLGSTEAGPISLCWHTEGGAVGGIGLPLPGVTLKLAPVDGKSEARVRSPTVTPGYWQRSDLTQSAFDAEGFLRTGDALDWIDVANPDTGLRYDGRIAEDFKLATGTWVRVGLLRARLSKELAPFVRDVVIAGENRNYVAVLGLPLSATIMGDREALADLYSRLAALALEATGSAQRVLRFAFLDAPLSIDAGELTDKGSINQRAVLRRHEKLVEQLYAFEPPDQVICVPSEGLS
jgi:feruloyl-CoA synthase